MFKTYSLILVLFTGSLANAANWTSTCATVTGAVTWDYCVNRDPQSRNPDVVYQLHGATESEHSWYNDAHGDRMRTAWRDSHTQPPTVVSISFGQLWLLTSKNSQPKSGLYDFFVRNVMPYIEARVPVRGRRLLFGYSMGGYNSAQLYLKNPELFAKVVLGCPAMAVISPYATNTEIADYKRRTGANGSYIQFSLRVSRDHYPDDASYQVDNPITKAAQNLNPAYPPLHISCGNQDQFGFQEGGEVFANIAAAQGVNVSWTLLAGKHCTMDEKSIAAFLTN